jgi:hypothetical protein
MFFVHVCRTESPVLGGNARESRITRGIQWISRAIDNVTADLGLTHDQAGLLVDRCLRKARAVVSLDELLNGEIFYTLKRNLLHPERGADHHRKMDETLQHEETAQCLGIPPTSPGNHRSDGPQAGHALTFKLDHSSGVGQIHTPSESLDERLHCPVNSQFARRFCRESNSSCGTERIRPSAV